MDEAPVKRPRGRPRKHPVMTPQSREEIEVQSVTLGREVPLDESQEGMSRAIMASKPTWTKPSKKRVREDDPLKGLTLRQAAFVGALKDAKTLRAAALQAGYTKADVPMKSPNVREAVRKILSDNGVSMDKLAERVREGMDAQQYQLTMKGEVVEMGPDWNARFKMIELAAKLAGAMPDPRLELTGGDGGAIVIRHSMALE